MPLADGFDFPCGPRDANGHVTSYHGYYKARGFWPNGHMGEDWNGKGGGNTDLGDPVYCLGDGVVVQSRDVRVGWGNVVIIRHVFRGADGKVKYVDSLYGHLNKRSVVLNQRVKRGQKVGTIGSNRGMYLAHLHLETRKNLYIGMHRSKFTRTYHNYHSPTSFIHSHRKCQSTSKLYPVPINTFAPYPGGTPVARNGQTPTLTTTTSKFEIPIKKRSTTESSYSQTTRKLDPKVASIVKENKSPAPKSKAEQKTKRRGLLSRLRSKYDKK